MSGFNVEGGLLSSDFEYVPYLDPFFKSDPLFRGRELEIYSHVNREVYEYLNKLKRKHSLEGGFWDFLFFINFLYKQLDIIKKHPNHPLKVVAHLRILKLDELQLYVLLTAIQKFYLSLKAVTLGMLDQGIFELRRDETPSFRICLDIIRREFSCLHEDYSVKQKKFTFLFEDIRKCIEISKEPEVMIENTKEWMNCYQQQLSRHPNLYVNDAKKFLFQCEILIKQIQKKQAEGYYKSNLIVAPFEIPQVTAPASKVVPVLSKKIKTKSVKISGDEALEKIFKDVKVYQELITHLRVRGYLDEQNNWLGEDNDIGILIDFLRNAGLSKIHGVRKMGRIICREFKIEYTDSLDDAIRHARVGKGLREALEEIEDQLKKILLK